MGKRARSRFNYGRRRAAAKILPIGLVEPLVLDLTQAMDFCRFRVRVVRGGQDFRSLGDLGSPRDCLGSHLPPPLPFSRERANRLLDNGRPTVQN